MGQNNVNYHRVVSRVKCNSCGDIKMDIDVELTKIQTISEGTYSVITRMDCKCGGTYEYF